MAIETTRLDPVLLTDEEMHQFLVDGFLILQPTVPVGTHEVTIWHETLGAQPRSVTVAAGETTMVEFTLQ